MSMEHEEPRQRRHKRSQVQAFSFLLILVPICLVVCLLAWALAPDITFEVLCASPENAVKLFYGYDGTQGAAEDMLMDPLIIAGRRVVPVVISEVARRNMPKRRYAIRFLGLSGDRRALPVLEQIADDDTEEDYVRTGAMVASGGLTPNQVSGSRRSRRRRARFWYRRHRTIWGGLLEATDRSYLGAFFGVHQ